MATRSTQTVVQVVASSNRVYATQVIIQVLGNDTPGPGSEEPQPVIVIVSG
jgi:hypothetical protein